MKTIYRLSIWLLVLYIVIPGAVVIRTAVPLDSNTMRIVGTGFKPAETNPTVTFSGVATTVDSINLDTMAYNLWGWSWNTVVVSAASNISENCSLIVANSDGDKDTVLFCSFWVSPRRTSDGDGSKDNPWTTITGSTKWEEIDDSLQIPKHCWIWWSSLDSFNTGGFYIDSTDALGWLYFIADTKNQTTATGTAEWQWTPIDTQMLFTSSGSGFLMRSDNEKFYMKGFHGKNCPYNPFSFGADGEPGYTNNVYDIVIDNCWADSCTNNQGIWFGYNETGCYNYWVKNCLVNNCHSEGIYMGHYTYLSNTITGIIIEDNTVYNCGMTDYEGDIDIKPGCFQAIVRNNVNYHDTGYATGYGSTYNLAVYADSVLVYNHVAYGTESGIRVTDFGGVGDGKKINRFTAFNCIAFNCKVGFYVDATHVGYGIDSIQFTNNIVWGDSTGIYIGGTGGASGRIVNNIIGESDYRDIDYNGTVNVEFDYNCWYNSLVASPFLSSGQDWTYWTVTLGNDANGINSDPSFAYYTKWDFDNNNFIPSTGSAPTIDSGTTILLYTFDKNMNSRPYNSVYDIGAYEYSDSAAACVNDTVLNILGLVGGVMIPLTPNSDTTINDGVNAAGFYINSSNGITQYELTISSGVGGSTDPSGIIFVYKDSANELTATAAPNYHFLYWATENGTIAWDDSTLATTNCTLSTENSEAKAYFGINTFTSRRKNIFQKWRSFSRW